MNFTLEEKQAMAKVLDFLMKYVSRSYSILNYVFALQDFTLIFREHHGIEAMARFLDYAFDHKMDDNLIRATIGHDLNGMNDEHFSPRTSSY